MRQISWDNFDSVELRVGTIIRVEKFPEAKKPAYKIWIDFGEEIGERKTSAQVTDLYSKEDLIGKQIVAVVNFPPKQIEKFMSECLITGFHGEGGVVLATPDKTINNGLKLS